MFPFFDEPCIYAVQIVTNALLSWPAGALSPPPPCRKAFQMHGARCSRIEGSGDGDGSYARARPSRSSGRSYRTSEFSRQMLSTLQLAWTTMVLLFFFLKRSLQASCRLQQGSSGSRFPSTRTRYTVHSLRLVEIKMYRSTYILLLLLCCSTLRFVCTSRTCLGSSVS